LVDEQSGESIELKKKGKKFAKYEGEMVTVAGRWVDNEPTSKAFNVSKVKPASEAADKSPKAHGKPQSPDAPGAPRSRAPESP
jgi:hypothetical protein